MHSSTNQKSKFCCPYFKPLKSLPSHIILIRRTMVREAWEPSKKLMLLSAHAVKCLSLLPSFLQVTPGENSIAVNNNNNNNNNNKTLSWLRRLVAGLPSRHRGPFPDQFMRDLCWIKWQLDRFLSEKFGFTLQEPFHHCLHASTS